MNRSSLFKRIEPDEQETHFDSFDHLMTDLTLHSNWLVGRKRKDFRAKWPIDNKQAMAALNEEFKEVTKASEQWEKNLKQTPPATQGIRLLQLFVQDLIGRKSRQARVFVNHLEKQQLEEKMVMSLGAKALAMTAIILVNLYFIFSCMLYGRTNGNSFFSVFLPPCRLRRLSISLHFVFFVASGIRWQRAWLSAALFSTAVDCFISQGIELQSRKQKMT